MLGLGRVGTRSEIPWSLVDRNWTAVQWAQQVVADGSSASPSAFDTLFLVDPAGGRYTVTTSSSDYRLVDWSGDLRHLLLARSGHALIIDTKSGSSRQFMLDDSSADVAFTAPSGTSLMVSTFNSGIKRIDLDGHVQASYTIPGSQPPLIPISSPDGSMIVVSGTTSPLLLDAKTGRLIRTLHPPRGDRNCTQTTWWSSNEVLLACDNNTTQELWTYPIDGSPPARLTDRRLPHPAHDAGVADLTAYRLESATYILESAGCGGTFLSRLQPDGSTRFLALPSAVVNPYDVRVAGESDTALELLGRSGCSSSTVLARFEPGTGKAFIQLGGPIGGGQVITAVGPDAYLP